MGRLSLSQQLLDWIPGNETGLPEIKVGGKGIQSLPPSHTTVYTYVYGGFSKVIYDVKICSFHLDYNSLAAQTTVYSYQYSVPGCYSNATILYRLGQFASLRFLLLLISEAILLSLCSACIVLA